MRGDDVAKSPHMARIAGSVYKDVDPKGISMTVLFMIRSPFLLYL
jgi:hypothetical protein